MAKIEGNKIIYPTHVVVADAEILADFGDEADQALYMKTMHADLTLDGTAYDHLLELQDMNNDGSWSVDFTPEQRETLKPLVDDFINAMKRDAEAYVEWERLMYKVTELLGFPKNTVNPLYDGQTLIIGLYEEEGADEFLDCIEF